MSNETPITIVGNLTADPELMFTPSGVALARFTVASTPRRFDKATGDYTDGETLFMRCTAWRESAEHVAESLNRGHRVVVTGRLRQSNWETPEGDKRSSIDLEVDEVGPSLRWATTKVTKSTRTGPGGPGGSGTDANDPWRQPPADRDPWAAPVNPGKPSNGQPVGAGAASANGANGTGGAGGPSWGGSADEPPF